MSFLTPLLFLGLGAIAIPIYVHLIQRERKRVIEFPSLMFIQKIPYQSVQRRRIRHWFLLLMRAAAILLIVGAFARPFLTGGAAAAATGVGSREIVIVLDHSASMGYGDHWLRAQAAATDVVASMGPNDRASLVLFGRSAEEQMRSTNDRGRLEAAITSATVTSGGTRYSSALRLAESILEPSELGRKEIVLISDFQRVGWTGSEDASIAEDIHLQTVPIRTDSISNLAVPSVQFTRAEQNGQERVTITAGIANRGAEVASDVPVTLEIDGHQVEQQTVSVPAGASGSVPFAPVAVASGAMRGTVRAGSDALPADNAFHFVLSPSRPVSVLVIDSGDRADSSFYLSRALAIGTAPAFRAEVMTPGRVTPDILDNYSVVIVNNTALPPAVGTDGLQEFVQAGGGLLVVFGDRTTWPSNDTTVIPGQPGAMVDRSTARAGTLGFLDRSHPVFEVFKAPRSGDFSAARILRYRPLAPGPDDQILARFDDGSVAAAERRIGEGRVIAFGTTLDDSWTDLALKPVYLPLVHQFVRYLSRYEVPMNWQTVGQVVDLSVLFNGRADRVVVTPSSEQTKVPASEPGVIELDEQGIYEVLGTSGPAQQIAVNLEPTESDLSPMDPGELAAAVTGRASAAERSGEEATALTPVESERQQGLWWYLLLAGLVLLTAEMVVSNRLSLHERFN
ncbi:MAG: BatA domain-containing protein [Vicinamibacterales bacterium]